VTTAAPPDQGEIACPRCGATVAGDQDWCLSCGDGARTRVVPTPNWRLPLLLAAAVSALALIAILLAFVQLTRDSAPVTTTTTTAPAATVPPATTLPPAATTVPPATTLPPAASLPPAATGGAPTTPAPTTTPQGALPGSTSPAPGATTTTP